MRYVRILFPSALALGVGLAVFAGDAATTAGSGAAASTPQWSFNATAIEACSCPMFCQCYFNSKPAAHGAHAGHGGGEHFCRANMGWKVNRGSYGDVKLDGLEFWLASDLGDDFSDGEMEWATVIFDKGTTQAQKTALTAVVGQLFPVKWKSLTTAEGEIAWKADKDSAHATVDGGKTAEVKLTRFQGMTDDPIVIRNLKYWGAPRNDGFVLMPNDVEAYRVGPKAFEFKGTNGFMITVDMSSKDTMAK